MNYSDYLKGTKRLLELSRRERQPYGAEIAGKTFAVYPQVFSPKYFRDTEIFAKNLPIKPGEKILEIGCGTGVVAIFAALKGADQVVATDINPQAVQNCKANIRLHELQPCVEVRQGDLFEPLQQGERFDTIFWNTPHGFVTYEPQSLLERAVFDPWYRANERFIKEGRQYLKRDGRLLIGFSSTLGKLDLLQQFCREAGLNLNLLYAEDSEEIYPVRFEIFEAK